ncbi:MAG: 50S ribosomal protein L19e [Candidatus Woesearchaeota archaeon]
MKLQKRLASQVLKCSKNKVRTDPKRKEELEAAITKSDIRKLVIGRAIWKEKDQGISRARARFKHEQRRKRRQSGAGKRKGKKNARRQQKRTWIEKIRGQKLLLQKLKQKNQITTQQHRALYLKAKGGFFRSIRHVKLYINEQLK